MVTLDYDDIFNYPWIYAVQVQNWTFTDAEAKRLREYLLKGGFLMVDDFHGTEDWENFMNGMRQVLPDRPVEDLQSSDEIFHTLYDIDDKMQIPGEQYVWTGRTYEKDGYQPKWRAIRDDKGRIIVAICHNMHLGDAWEWADDPELSGDLRLHGVSRGPRLHHLWHDALIAIPKASSAEHKLQIEPQPAMSQSIQDSEDTHVSVPLQIPGSGFHQRPTSCCFERVARVAAARFARCAVIPRFRRPLAPA